MKIKELLTDESKWTKGDVAKDANGFPTASFSNSAVCWCLAGALIKCYTSEDKAADKKWGITYAKMMNYIREKTPFSQITDFNDNPNTTFADIRKLVEELDI